jgi:hypothetical protein
MATNASFASSHSYVDGEMRPVATTTLEACAAFTLEEAIP